MEWKTIHNPTAAALVSTITHSEWPREESSFSGIHEARSRGGLFVEVPPPISLAFQFIRVLGQGSFGIVYHAREMNLMMNVAIKVFNPAYSEAMVRWHREEGRTVACLNHPSIVRVHMSGMTDDNRWYISYGYVEGCDLSKIIRAGRLPFNETASIITSVSAALHYAHEHGFVHRDVKPANILMDCRGAPCLTDFGLAIRLGGSHEAGSIAGTPAYMSPEQWKGEEVDRRTDIWSTGVVLYEMLLGRRPFAGDTTDKLRKSINEDVPPLLHQVDNTIPEDLGMICARCLEKEPGGRFQSGEELAKKLSEVSRR
jgi:eukaryotic-like serine/threonine-protein kinase